MIAFDLGIVLAFAAEHVDNSPVGLFASSGQSVIRTTALSPVVRRAVFGGNEYVGGQKFGIGAQESELFFRTCSVPIIPGLSFRVFRDDSFGSLPRTRAAMVTR